MQLSSLRGAEKNKKVILYKYDLFLFGTHMICTYICTIKSTKMLTTTLSDFRKDIKSYLDKVTQSFETLIINRGKDTGVVVISLEEYNSLKSTQHELSSRINQQRLDESIEALKSGKKLIKKLAD